MGARRLAPALLLVLSGALAACAATEIEAERVESPHFAAADGTYSLALPLGWIRAENALTLDGWERQTITFNAGAVLDPEEGRALDVAAPELMAAMRDQLAAQPGILLREVRAAKLDGLPGFRMHYRQAPERDAEPAEIVVYGAVEGVMLFAFSLESRAPATLTRDLAVFELMVASFRRSKATPAVP